MAQGPTDLLQRVPIFQGLEPRELERIGSSMKQRTFNAGDTVTAEGTGGVGFFVIESGQARVTIGGKDRRTLGPGDYFGDIALIDQGARTATITAASDLHTYGLVNYVAITDQAGGYIGRDWDFAYEYEVDPVTHALVTNGGSLVSITLSGYAPGAALPMGYVVSHSVWFADLCAYLSANGLPVDPVQGCIDLTTL